MSDNYINGKVWIVDDDGAIRFVVDRALTKEGFNCEVFPDGESALKKLAANPPECIISDIKMPGIDGISMLREIHRKYANIPVIITTAHSDLINAVRSYENGSFEYLPKPFDLDDCVSIVKKAVSQYRKLSPASPDISLLPPSPSPAQTSENHGFTELIGESQAMQDVYRVIGRISHSNVSVLIMGESGTGKELVARAIYRHSTRNKKPFVALNMAAIPQELIESELFGHEKGSFTGANSQRIGRFEEANTGTLFLDEIGDMPMEAQTRLLRVLENREFYRVGGQSPISVDVRILAATNKNLPEYVRKGLFREDLYFRLNVISIHIPPLRDRADDIEKLTGHFLGNAGKEMNVPSKILRHDSLEILRHYSWPGNIRQLQNVCRWLTVMAPGQIITPEDLPDEVKSSRDDASLQNRMPGIPVSGRTLSPESCNSNGSDDSSGTIADAGTAVTDSAFPKTTGNDTASPGTSELRQLKTTAHAVSRTDWEPILGNWVAKQMSEGNTEIQKNAMATFEFVMLKEALKYTHGKKIEAARILGIGRNTITRKLQEFRDRFKTNTPHD